MMDNNFITLIAAAAVLLIGFKLIRLFKRNKSDVFDFERDHENAHQTQDFNYEKKGEKTTLIGFSNNQSVYIKNSSHIFVCGTTGSGKTVALSNLIKSATLYDYPMLIIDGKGDTNENSLLDIVNKLANNQRKIYIVNLNDPKKSMKYNPFKNTSSTVIKDMLINMTTWSEEHYKLNTERYLQKLIDLLIKDGKQTSFKNITQNMETENFIKLSMELTKKEIISKDEHINNISFVEASKKIIDGAVARFASLYESEVGSIFDDNGVDIYTAIKENAIILFILNPLLYPETSPLFGHLIVIDSKKAVSNLYNSHQDRIFFIFDEINVYAGANLLDLVNKSRSANVTCTLATQSLSDLDAVDGTEILRKQLIENCNNYIFLRQNEPENAEKIANIIGTKESMQPTYQISGGSGEAESTNKGSLRKTREYIYHPQDIKSFKRGEAIYLSREDMIYTKIQINKPF